MSIAAPERLTGLPRFVLPPELEAAEPPEARGVPRDGVRLLISYRADGRLVHTAFSQLPRFLSAGDLLVINTSGTLAAAVPGTGPDGAPLIVHLSSRLPDGRWTVELRRNDRLWPSGHAGQAVALPDGGRVVLDEPYAEHPDGIRLWVATLALPVPLDGYLRRRGQPITYSYVRERWPIATYQNVYATEPGSAEMPSAGRPFTPEIITRLVAAGVGIAPLVLHTGVASLEASEPPYPEYFRLPADTAHRVNDTRRRGGRVVAVGTTVVRALESAVGSHGTVQPAEGWTDLVVTPDRGVLTVDGLITGLHEPGASHLAMLEAVAGPELVRSAYAAALALGYLWHEFGDVHLILP